MSTNYEATVADFYFAYFGHAADPGALEFWSAQLEQTGSDFDAIVNAFASVDLRAPLERHANTVGARIEARHPLESGAPAVDGRGSGRASLDQVLRAAQDARARPEAVASTAEQLIGARAEQNANAISNSTGIMQPHDRTVESTLNGSLLSPDVVLNAGLSTHDGTEFLNITPRVANTTLANDMAAYGTHGDVANTLAGMQSAPTSDVSTYGSIVELTDVLAGPPVARAADQGSHRPSADLNLAANVTQNPLDAHVAAHGGTIDLAAAQTTEAKQAADLPVQDTKAALASGTANVRAAPDTEVPDHGAAAGPSDAPAGANASPGGDIAAHGAPIDVGNAAAAQAASTPSGLTVAAIETITGFMSGSDKLHLADTSLLSGTFGDMQTGVAHLTIDSVINGVVIFGGDSAATATDAMKIDALLQAMGSSATTAAFVSGANTYVVHGDGQAGTQSTDTVVELIGVVVTDLSHVLV